MLNSITIDGYYVSFAQHNPLGFNTGVTCITGRNGRGKSSVLEMIRFALFGSAALRRPASDYKRLDVSLEFTLRGEDYRVVRSPRQVMLFKGDTPLATGSTPVNKAVVELFGYGLQVFDIANCCNQNQVMAFSDSMKPAERKRMIDQTVGLGAVDEVSEELNREALDLAKEVKFLTARWPEGAPAEPVKDVGFRPSEELRPLVGNVQNMVAELNQLRGKAAMPAPVEPAEPEVRNLLNSRDPVVLVKTMEDYADALPDLKAKASRFEYLTTCLATRQVPSVGEEPKAPKTLFHVEQLEASIAARNEARILRLQRRELQLPTMAPAEIEAANAALHLYNRVLAKRELLKQGTTECPNCHTSFPNAHSALDHYADVPDEMERPTWTADYLARQLFLQDNIQKADSLDEQILNKEHVLLEDDKELLAGVRAYEQAHRLWLSDKQRQEEVIAERGRWEVELKGFKWNPVTDYQSIQKAAADLKEDLNDLMRHEREVKDFRAAVAARAELEARLAELTSAEPEECLQALQGALESSLKYEADYQRYTKDFRQWEQDEAKIGELSATIQDLQAGVKALKELKARVKTHLLPSLNTVASLLVSEMTGGEISEIKLDEAFDISVNGTAIEALSGSGKAVANLALRLGLGQVLTNKVFSVFLGDELDASMDEHRAAYLMGCLHRLKGQVSQIVLVTHKPSLEADHYISL